MDHEHLENFDIGIVDGSTKKNSLGTDGSVGLAALIVANPNIKYLSISGNDLGKEGGDFIGTALLSNHTLRVLKVDSNQLNY